MAVLQPPLGHERLRIWVDVRVSGECPAEDGILLDLDIPTLGRVWAQTHQIFATTIEPFGMKYPRYSSSSRERWGTPTGTTDLQRRSSLMSALMYGSESLSENSGRRWGPTTESSSACAFCCTAGNEAMASTNDCTVESV